MNTKITNNNKFQDTELREVNFPEPKQRGFDEPRDFDSIIRESQKLIEKGVKQRFTVSSQTVALSLRRAHDEEAELVRAQNKCLWLELKEIDPEAAEDIKEFNEEGKTSPRSKLVYYVKEHSYQGDSVIDAANKALNRLLDKVSVHTQLIEALQEAGGQQVKKNKKRTTRNVTNREVNNRDHGDTQRRLREPSPEQKKRRKPVVRTEDVERNENNIRSLKLERNQSAECAKLAQQFDKLVRQYRGSNHLAVGMLTNEEITFNDDDYEGLIKFYTGAISSMQTLIAAAQKKERPVSNPQPNLTAPKQDRTQILERRELNKQFNNLVNSRTSLARTLAVEETTLVQNAATTPQEFIAFYKEAIAQLTKEEKARVTKTNAPKVNVNKNDLDLYERNLQVPVSRAVQKAVDPAQLDSGFSAYSVLAAIVAVLLAYIGLRILA